MENAGESIADQIFMWPWRWHAQASLALQAGPTARPVHVLQLQTGFLQELGERDAVCGVAGSSISQRPQLPDHRGTPGRDGRSQILEHDLLRDAIELHRAAGRQERKAELNLLLDL